MIFKSSLLDFNGPISNTFKLIKVQLHVVLDIPHPGTHKPKYMVKEDGIVSLTTNHNLYLCPSYGTNPVCYSSYPEC